MAWNLPRVVYEGYEEVKKDVENIICQRIKEPAGGYDEYEEVKKVPECIICQRIEEPAGGKLG